MNEPWRQYADRPLYVHVLGPGSIGYQDVSEVVCTAGCWLLVIGCWLLVTGIIKVVVLVVLMHFVSDVELQAAVWYFPAKHNQELE